MFILGKYFPSVKNHIFVRQLLNIWYLIGLQEFYKIIYHILCIDHQPFECSKFSMYLSWKRQTSAESAGNGSNLNYRCLIECLWFFPKIIFSFTSIYFITDPMIVLQDSTPSREGSCPPFWPHLESSIRNSKKIKILWNLRIVSCFVT
jgi:hypothetical protein